MVTVAPSPAGINTNEATVDAKIAEHKAVLAW